MEKSQRTEQIIEGLLAKPNKKPDFKNFKGSDILKRAQQFIPMFIQTTDRLLSDPELLKQKQMDIRLEENGDLQMEMRRLDGQGDQEEDQDPNMINMDIGVGVYDVNNENFDEKTFKPSSTRPIVRFNGLIENEDEDAGSDSSSDDDGSDDSNLYYEFNSDSENVDASSLTTKATNNQQNQRPLIQDITPSNIQQQNEETKKIQNNKKKNNKKRLRR